MEPTLHLELEAVPEGVRFNAFTLHKKEPHVLDHTGHSGVMFCLTLVTRMRKAYEQGLFCPVLEK